MSAVRAPAGNRAGLEVCLRLDVGLGDVGRGLLEVFYEGPEEQEKWLADVVKQGCHVVYYDREGGKNR
jgi:hypothetical protein